MNEFVKNILNAITNGLTKLIGAVKKFGLIYSLVAMLLFVGSYTLIVNPIRVDQIVEKRIELVMEKENNKAVEVREISIEKRYKADEIVGDIMVKLIDKYDNIQRVLLLEKHNSLQSISGVDFLYLSCSMEMLTPNSTHLNYLSEDLQKQIVVNLMGNDMINTLKHRDYLYYPDVAGCKHPQHRLIHKLRDAGDKECVIIPFKDANHRPLLLFVITGQDLDVEGITDYIQQFSKTIEDCLL